MFSLVAFVAIMVAPAMAGPINYCPGTYTYIRYLNDAELKKAYTAGAIAQLDTVADASGEFDPYAFGDDVITFADVDLYLGNGDIVEFAATVLAANGDPKGFVTVFNTYTGQVVDCKYQLKFDYFRVKGKACYYKVDKSIVEVCQEAKGEFTVSAFAAGTGAIVTDSSSVQVIGLSATSIDIAAVGSNGLSTDVNAKDSVGKNSAQSLLNTFQQGNSKLNASVDNLVTDTSSSTNIKINATSTSSGTKGK